MANDEWVKLDSRRNIGEATLAQQALELESIPVELRGEHRPSIAGELPLPEAEIELWVPREQLESARTLLASLQSAVSGPDWACAKCSEQSPSNFEVCWKCGAQRPEAAP